MNNQKIIQEYINNFRRHLAPHLRPSIGLACKVFPAIESGAILEFSIGPGISNTDEFRASSQTINEALSGISQRAYGGNLGGFRFGGTNVVMEDNRIIFIKGEDDQDQWNDQAALADVKRILPPRPGGGK
jgi:hypothetical protein